MKAIFQDAIHKVKANPTPKIKDPAIAMQSNTTLDMALDDIIPILNPKSSTRREELAHPYKSTLTEQKKLKLREKFGGRLHMKDETSWAHDKEPALPSKTESFMVFVRNLPPNSNILTIKSAFDKYGLIKGVRVYSL